MAQPQTFDDWFDPRHLALLEEARAAMPALMAKQHELRKAGLNPTAVLMPSRFNLLFSGEGSDPDFKGYIMCLPIQFSRDDTWGLVVKVAP